MVLFLFFFFFCLAKLDYSTGFCLHWYSRVESGDKGRLVDFSQMKAKGKEPEEKVEFLGKFFKFYGRLLNCRFSRVTGLASFSTGAVPGTFT